MKLLFSMAYDGRPYKDKETTDDYRPVGPLTLLGLLERELGLMPDVPLRGERLAAYHVALTDFADGAFYQSSFTRHPLATAEQLLHYRDELLMQGWHSILPGQPTRLALLARVEKRFAQSEKHMGVPDRWLAVLSSLNQNGVERICIKDVQLDEPAELLPPLLRQIFDVMGKLITPPGEIGDKRSDNLGLFCRHLQSPKEIEPCKSVDQNDSSIRILEFPSLFELQDYLALAADENKHLIVSMNRSGLDDAMRCYDRPATGSLQLQSYPAVIQVFQMMIPQIVGEPDIETLLALLQSPVSPVPFPLPHRLSHVLDKKPGLKNDMWTKTIAEYLNPNDADKSDTANEKQEREHLIRMCFGFNAEQRSIHEHAHEVLGFVIDWATALVKQGTLPELIPQYEALIELCEEAKALIDPTCTTIDEARKILTSCYRGGNFPYVMRERGSTPAVDDLACIAGPINRDVIFADFHIEKPTVIPDGFILEDERRYLKDQDLGYRQIQAIKLLYYQWLRGLTRIHGRLILCDLQSRHGTGHPLKTRLDYLFPESSYDALTEKATPQVMQHTFGKESSAFSGVKPVVQQSLPAKVSYLESEAFKHVQLRPIESFSSLSKLIKNPFDYVMHYSARFEPPQSVPQSLTEQLKGNLAHRVIELLAERFDLAALPAGWGDHEIKAALDDAIDEQGAVLLNPRLRIARMSFEEKVIQAVHALTDFIKRNELSVEGCEVDISGIDTAYISLEDQSIQLDGLVDLLLKDARGNFVVLDMKWTENTGKYEDIITRGIDLQLALYRQVFGGEEVRSLYFLMPVQEFITAHAFEGVLTPENAVPNHHQTMQYAAAGIAFRLDELRNGKTEIAEGEKLTDLPYYQENDLRINIRGKNEKNKYNSYDTELRFFKGQVS